MRISVSLFISIFLIFLLAGCTQSSLNNQSDTLPFGGDQNGAQQPGFDNNFNNPLPPQANPPQNQPMQNPPSNGSPQNNLPPSPGSEMQGINPNAPLPSLPADVPKGEWITKKFGDIEVKYFSTAITRGMTESGTDFFIKLKNTGSSKESVCFTGITPELRSLIPSWNLHFFSLQDSPIELSAGEEKRLWYFASIDLAQNMGSSYFSIPFNVGKCNSPANSVDLNVTFGGTNENFWGKETSYIYGSVKDESGTPVSGATVVAMMNCGRMDFKAETDPAGNYKIPLLGMEDINAIYLGKELACDSIDYFLSLEKENYDYYYNGHVAPTRKEPKQVDIILKEKPVAQNYSLEWEKKIEDNFGFFWIKPSSDWSVFAAAQSKHPPELNKPTNFYLLDALGNILWKQPTQNECWGIDITNDGSKVVAGCHDGKVYAVNRSGEVLWNADFGSMVRSACISDDGTKVLSGTAPTLINSSNGTKQDLKWQGDWLRNCAFYSDNSGFVAGARDVTGIDMQGNQKWRNVIGEFPLFMGVDNKNNTFATGKSRTLFDFSSTGEVLWKHRIPDHTATAGAVTPAGNRIALGTVGGMVYLFDESGNLLWKRGSRAFPNASSAGHNAVAISNDGKLIVVGTAPQNCLVAYNEIGTIVWENCITPDATNKDLLLGVMNVQISSDKKEIIAAYGDNYIRKFRAN
ncbi:PQQ-like domain protein [uncultured archaeon]|nr:PQQ-like domain protein [uncultured archaeon]